MTSRSPKHNDRGFTLIEMVVVIAVVGILTAIAIPTFLSLNKPLQESTAQFKNQLNLIRSRAIASSQAYRLRPKYPTRVEYPGQRPNSFIVEYAANCRITTYGPAATAGTPNGWLRISELDIDLPQAIGVDGTATAAIQDTPQTPTPDANLNWSVCYDNRGIARQAVIFTLKDFQGNNRAQSATLSVQPFGTLAITTNDRSGTAIPPVNGNPIF